MTRLEWRLGSTAVDPARWQDGCGWCSRRCIGGEWNLTGQAWLRPRSGRTQWSVEGWLTGTGSPMSGEQAARVAAEYGVPVSFLLYDRDQVDVGEQLRMLIAVRDRR